MNSKAFSAIAACTLAASALAGPGPVTNFGTLTDSLGNEISFDAGTGNSNTDFMYQNINGQYTFGLSTQTRYISENGPVTNNGVDTFYVQAGADQSGNDDGGPGGVGPGRWGIKWSITTDGDGGVPSNLVMALRIDGPSGGSFGWLDPAVALPVVEYPVPEGDYAYANQQTWGMHYGFLQADSADYGLPAGIWDGLAYDFDELGTYTIQIKLWEVNGGALDELSTMSMNVEVVPAPGALALLGLSGFARRRRRG